MRLTVRALLVLAASTAAAADDAEVVRLKLGESRPGFGTVRPVCDAPSVATLEAGVLRAVGVGETLCSAATVQAQGTRRLYRVVVTPPDPPGGKGGERDGAGRGERAPR